MLVTRQGFKPKVRKLDTSGSKTVPDQSISVKDIMSRYKKNQPLPESKGNGTPVWVETTHDSPDLEKIRDMETPDKIQFAKDFLVKEKKKPEPEKVYTRKEWEDLNETRLTAEQWSKIKAPNEGPA